MITPHYVRMMARYNAWQNVQLTDALKSCAEADLTRDRGAFFGSILGTLNHILWAGRVWLSRMSDVVERPDCGIPDSAWLHPTLGAWSAERYHVDGWLRHWADRLRAVDLSGDLHWKSGATGKAMRRPLGLCIPHMFNHQTHHRGQVHAMLTQAGLRAPVSDLAFIPEELEP